MKDIVLKYVLDNSVRFNGNPNSKAVIGSILGAVPELRNNIKAVSVEVEKTIKEISKLSLDEQKKKLEEIGGGVARKAVVKEERDIPELEGDVSKVVMRFAPNPNGPIHLGHCRQALWNWFFVEKYDGEFILRFDDTDPRKKAPMKEAYDWFIEDLKWLGVTPHKVVKQSTRFDTYYGYAEKLIKKDGAYICDCGVEDWRALIKKKKGCKCRELGIEEQLKRWKKMFKGYKEGEAVYRVKTELSNPNPSLRDWPGFRIVDETKHPFLNNVRVWPLLNFASAIDDHEFGVTHILRGVDLMICDDKQKFIYDYFGWTYPKTRYSGKLLVAGLKSTSQIKLLIKEGKYLGWDDPRLITIKALKRKGYCNEAIVKFIRDVGINRSDVNVAVEKLASFNKDYLDMVAHRYFFVKDPVMINVEGLDSLKLELDLHPDNQKGGRKFKITEDFYIEKNDLDKWKVGSIVRLMDCVNVLREKNGFKYHSKTYDEFKAAKGDFIIHWLPLNVIKVKVMIDGVYVNGLVEDNFNKCKDDEIVQFVRFGFLRVDKAGKELWFAHK